MDSWFTRLQLIIFTLLFQGVLHADQVTIYGIEIPGLHQQDHLGSYDKIIKQVLSSEQLAKLQVYPPARAQLMFAQCKKNCCFTPANKRNDFYHFDEEVIQTDAMNIAKIYIFTAKNQPTIDSLAGLQNKKVGARTGMPYGTHFENAHLTIAYVDTIEQNIKKLALGRIDAFIAYVPDAYNVFRKLNMSPLPHNIDKPIAIHQDRLVCKGVSQHFINTFNKNLTKLKQEQQLKKLLGQNYIAP